MEFQLQNHLFSSNANAKKIVFDYINLLAEVVFDITLMAQHGIDFGSYECEESRSLKNSIVSWAIEFIETMPNRGGNDDDEEYDYIEAVDMFAEQKMIESYGIIREFDVSCADGFHFRVHAKTAQEALHILSERVLTSFKSQLVIKP